MFPLGHSSPGSVQVQILGTGSRLLGHTVCPRSSDPFYIVTYYIKWVTTSWTYRFISIIPYLRKTVIGRSYELKNK